MATLPVFGAADISAFFKNRYPQRKLENLVKYGKPLLEMLPKGDELTGTATIVPILLDSPQGLGNNLAHAADQADDGSGAGGGGSMFGKFWTLTRAKRYATLYLDAETMMASRNDEGAFFKQKEKALEMLIEGMGQHLEMALWAPVNGALGQIAADPGTGTTFTMLYTQDGIKFHRGMKILFYANSSGAVGAVRSGGPYTVLSVDEDTGIVTVSAALDTIIGSDDWVVRATNDAGGATDAGNDIQGVPSWIPPSVTSTPFFGVDRTLAPQKLAGWRQGWLGSIEETAKRLDAKMRRVRPSAKKVLWLSYANFSRLEIELGARGMRVEDGDEGVFNRSALKMSTPSGGCLVKPGPYVPENAGFMLDMDTWQLKSLGGLPHLVEDDGNSALRLTIGANSTGNNADGIEMRYRYFAQLLCTSPYDNGRFTIV